MKTGTVKGRMDGEGMAEWRMTNERKMKNEKVRRVKRKTGKLERWKMKC